MGNGTPVASETELQHKPPSIGVVAKHLAIEVLARVPAGRVSSGGWSQLAAGGAVAVPHAEFKAQIGRIHRCLLDVDAFAQRVDLCEIKAGVCRTLLSGGSMGPRARVS